MKMNSGEAKHTKKLNAMYQMHWVNFFFFFYLNYGKPILGRMFGHQRAEIYARNKKINRGQETYPIRVNARYEMDWTEFFFFKKFRKPCLQTDGRLGESSMPQSDFGGAGV